LRWSSYGGIGFAAADEKPGSHPSVNLGNKLQIYQGAMKSQGSGQISA
jgi:hypothetical protein